MKFGEYGKKLGGMWKEMDEEAKAPYQAKAVADKERYAKEMESYTPPPAEEGDDEEGGEEEGGKKKKAKKKKKDPNAPKRGLSGFM